MAWCRWTTPIKCCWLLTAAFGLQCLFFRGKLFDFLPPTMRDTCLFTGKISWEITLWRKRYIWSSQHSSPGFKALRGKKKIEPHHSFKWGQSSRGIVKQKRGTWLKFRCLMSSDKALLCDQLKHARAHSCWITTYSSMNSIFLLSWQKVK